MRTIIIISLLLSCSLTRAQILKFDTAAFLWSSNGIRPIIDADLTTTPRVWGQQYLQDGLGALAVSRANVSTGVVAVIGDSWSVNQRYVGKLATILRNNYGDAGSGWISWANQGSGIPGSADSRVTSVTEDAAWQVIAGYTTAPDTSGIRSMDATGSPVLSATLPGATVLQIHYAIVPGGGDFNVSTDGGSTYPTTVSTDGTAAYGITNISPSAGSFTLKIKQTSAGTAGTTIYGVDSRTNATYGIRVHGLGHSGATAFGFVGVDSNQWQTGITALNPNLVVILLATNDQASRTPAQIAADLLTLTQRIRYTIPSCSVAVMVPCENGLGRATTMQSIAEAVWPMCKANQIAWCNLQYYYGLGGYSTYGYGSALNFFASDNLHPSFPGAATGSPRGIGPILQAYTELLNL